MDCKKAEKHLVEYLYQELSPKYTVDLEKHLEVCDKCTQTLENWRAIHRGYQKTADEAPAVPYLKQRILSAAKEELQRKPSFSERFFLVLKPALILPVILFGLIATLMLYQNKPKTMMTEAPVHAVPEQPSVSSSSLDLDKAKAPKREMYGERKPDTYSNERAKLQPEDQEKLKSLGYIGTGSEERDRISTADEKAGAKDNANKEYRQDAPASRTEIQEPQKEIAPQEQNASKNETGQATGGALAPSTPPASAPAQVQQLEAKKMAKVATTPERDFEVAQENFARNNLNDGVAAANQAIQNDKSQGKADLAVQFHEAGKRYQASKEPEQAIVQYNLVLNNYPGYGGSPDVLLRLAESYEQIGDYNQALKAYQQLSQIPAMKTTADRRINSMQKKQKTRDQLKSLGYTDPEKKNQ